MRLHKIVLKIRNCERDSFLRGNVDNSSVDMSFIIDKSKRKIS